MALTELNNKQNTYYQKQNHVKHAKNQTSKRYIDPALGTAPGGGEVPKVPHSPDVQFDAYSAKEGMANEWASVVGGITYADAVTAVPIVTIEGRLGYRFHQDDHPGATKPAWRAAVAPPVNLLCFMAVTFEDPIPTVYRNPIGNDAAANRGLYINTGTMAGELTGAGSTGVRRLQANFDRRADTGSFALGIPDTDVHIMAGYHASRQWNALGNRVSTTVDHIANGVIHEILFWYDANILDDAQMDDVTNYLNDKWGFGLTP